MQNHTMLIITKKYISNPHSISSMQLQTGFGFTLLRWELRPVSTEIFCGGRAETIKISDQSAGAVLLRSLFVPMTAVHTALHMLYTSRSVMTLPIKISLF